MIGGHGFVYHVAMKHVVMALLLAVGCSKGSGSATKTDDTKAKFEAAGNAVKGGDKWDAAVKTLTDKLGAPKQTTDTDARWAAISEGDCYEIHLMRNAGGDTVNGVSKGHESTMVEGKCKALAEGK